MKKSSLAVIALLSPIILSGCATISKDANQSVQIETYSKDNKPINGAKCSAQNDRGIWTTTTPGTVYVHRSGTNLQIKCEKDQEEQGMGTVVSRASGAMFGNILLGGGIGAIIDHNKGTAYTYPSWLRIVMGDTLVYDRKDEKDNIPMLGKSTQDATPAPTTQAQAIPATN